MTDTPTRTTGNGKAVIASDIPASPLKAELDDIVCNGDGNCGEGGCGEGEADGSGEYRPKNDVRSARQKSASQDAATDKTDTGESDMRSRTVEIIKRPGQTLGFYIREGNGVDRADGVFISRIATGSVVESNSLLRVADEITSINGVDVTRASLDDVVILMSIAKRLVLNVKTRHGVSRSKNASCPSLCTIEQKRPTPVVVLKHSYGGPCSLSDRTPNRIPLPATSAKNPCSRSISNPSELEDDRPIRAMQSRLALTPETDDSQITHRPEAQYQRHDTVLQSSHTNPSLHDLHIQNAHTMPRTARRPPSTSAASHKDVTRGRRSPYVAVDYSSDSDARCTSDRGRRSRPLAYDSAAAKLFHDELERAIQGRDPNASSRGSTSPDRYNSDSEVMWMYETRRPLATNSNVNAAGALEDKSNSMPQIETNERISGSGQRLQHDRCDQLVKTPEAVRENDPSLTTDADHAVSDGNRHVTSGSRSAEVQCDSYTANEYWAWMSDRKDTAARERTRNTPGLAEAHKTPSSYNVTSKQPQINQTETQRAENTKSDVGRAGVSTTSADKHRQLTRPSERMYSLMCTGTVNRERDSSSRISTKSGTDVVSYPDDADGATRGRQVRKPPPTTRVKQPSRAVSLTRGSDAPLLTKTMELKTEEFRLYQPDMEEPKAGEARIHGLIHMHIFCGHGLKASRTMLRDLYCVIEVDAVNRARTMIRTGAMNFDWDEQFDVDLHNASELSFLVYSWDASTRHRLCFSSTLHLRTFLQYGTKQKIALKLEPKGILYVMLAFKEAAVALRRTPSANAADLFGVDLESVIRRQRSSHSVPILVKLCVEEVERRGMEQVGIYRLCGSAKRKAQLKEELTKRVDRSTLSPENVPDINVVSGILKDFLRELPEPLFTNALYQMLLDALSVRLPGDPDGSAKLVLSILECLPKTNQDTMALLLDHLKRVSLKSDVNKMNTQNLAVCFGPVLLCPSLQSTTGSDAMDFKKHIEMLKYLLDIWPERTQDPSDDSSRCQAVSDPEPVTESERPAAKVKEEKSPKKPKEQVKTANNSRRTGVKKPLRSTDAAAAGAAAAADATSPARTAPHSDAIQKSTKTSLAASGENSTSVKSAKSRPLSATRDVHQRVTTKHIASTRERVATASKKRESPPKTENTKKRTANKGSPAAQTRGSDLRAPGGMVSGLKPRVAARTTKSLPHAVTKETVESNLAKKTVKSRREYDSTRGATKETTYDDFDHV